MFFDTRKFSDTVIREFDTVGTLHRSFKDAKHPNSATLDVPESSQVLVFSDHIGCILILLVSQTLTIPFGFLSTG